MLFNSLDFCIFFPVVTALYFLLPHKWRWLLLLLASCLFYMAFIPAYLLILIFTILIDYAAGIWIENAEGNQKKQFLVLSIVANVGVLAFFKYYNFFIFNINEAFSSQIPLLKILLPIGLSFHTFQAMSYTIEVYRGKQKAERHLGIYALYVMYYPQLVAGPIERPQNILPQFYKEQHFDYDRVTSGLKLMAWGLFKKMAIADRLAMFVDTAYSDVNSFHNVSLVQVAIFFAFQIYCDFSGYSDIAVGASRVMGIELMQNFRQPYFATSISDFWKRWHISLSSWLNDYLYMPIVFALRDYEKWAVIAGLIITFCISGLWHGAAWHYILFGFFYGIALSLLLLTTKLRKKVAKKVPTKLYDALSILITFAFTCLMDIFFRAKDVPQAFLFIQNMFVGWSDIAQKGIDLPLFTMGIPRIQLFIAIVGIFILLGVDILKTHFSITDLLKKMPIAMRYSLYWAFLILFYTMGLFGTKSTFIYFQF